MPGAPHAEKCFNPRVSHARFYSFGVRSFQGRETHRRVQLNVGLRFRKSVDYIRYEEVTAEKGRLDLNNPLISIRGIQGVCGASLVGRS
jgi:hypothetical protein